MDIMYKSTRSNSEPISSSRAILNGLAPDGGLYVPTAVPKIEKSFSELAKLDYKGLAYEVMKLFLPDFTEEELKGCIERAYDEKFDTKEIAPLVEKEGAYYLELFHGATIAFKDMALSILPHLMTTAAKKEKIDDEIVILTATSGDTGKAALAGFADVPGIRIIVFYPKGGVSRIQELQMVTQKGDNTHVVAIHGNFDDAQTGVKKIFNDSEMKAKLQEKGFRFSSANSINIGRLVPQIVYYVYAYCTLLKCGKIKEGDKINICVPTGNFGNILAAYYAKLAGLPVSRFICASNENKVLFDFFGTGNYDRNRKFILTTSPSMDILISSNLERLIYRICDDDPEKNLKLMSELSKDGHYSITPEMKEKIEEFYGGFASEEENFAGIADLFKKTGYVIDTHTGIGNAVYRQYAKETGDKTPTVIASTASPFKFAKSVVKAIEPDVNKEDDFAYCDELSRISGIDEPEAINSIRHATVRHTLEADPENMARTVLDIL